MTSAFESVKAFKDETDATRNNLFAGLRNQDPSAVTSDDVLTATQAATTTLTDIAATAARLDATVKQSVSGFGGGGNDQFERLDTSLGADWNIVDTGAGELITDGHNATWSPSGGSANKVIARNTSVSMSSDVQVVRLVLSEPLSDTSAWILFARMNTAQDSYVYGLFKKNYLEVGYAIAGTETVIESSTDPFDPPPGTTIELWAGVTLPPVFTDWFGLYISGYHVGDTSAAPLSGSNYLNAGFGCDVQTDSGAQVSPGSVALWSAVDNATDVVGVYFESRPSADSTGNTEGDLLYDEVVRQSRYLSFNSVTGYLTVELPGSYVVTVTWGSSTPVPATKVFQLGVQRSSPPTVDASTALVGTGSAESSGFHEFTTTLYLEAGDVINPWMYITFGSTVSIDASRSSFRVAKTSPPYFA